MCEKLRCFNCVNEGQSIVGLYLSEHRYVSVCWPHPVRAGLGRLSKCEVGGGCLRGTAEREKRLRLIPLCESAASPSA